MLKGASLLERIQHLSLDELTKLVEQAPEKEREFLLAQAEDIAHKNVWTPTPGPQMDAFYSPADILLYGGSGGSGKTDLICGLALTQHYQTLIMRRKYVDLGGIIERFEQLNGGQRGFNKQPPPKLKRADGRTIDFGAAQHKGDEQSWQGRPHDLLCVGRGTPVLMASGKYKPIEAIVAGDYVETLEGARRVTRAFPAQWKKSVRVKSFDSGGNLIGEQVQSFSHALLTREGWISHDRSASIAPSLTSSSTVSQEPYRASKQYALTSAPLLHTHAILSLGLRRVCELLQSLVRLARPGLKVPCAYAGLQGLENASVGSYGLFRTIGRHRGLTLSLRPKLPVREMGGGAQNTLHSAFSYDAPDVRSSSLSLNSTGHYSGGSHPYDGQPLVSSYPCSEQGGGQQYLLRLVDVEQPNPTYSAMDGLGQTPIYSDHTTPYSHPYTKDVRYTERRLEACAYSVSEIGVRELFDIEVEEVNHYITRGGFVNKNCLDEATQFLESQVRFLLGWLRSTRKGQRVRCVMATNPPIDSNGDWIIGFFRPWLDLTYKNPAKHGELRWFVTAPDGSDVEVPGPEMIQLPGMKDAVQPMSRTFIPGKLSDNPFLAQTGYQAKLDALPEPLRSAVRDGNFMAARADAEWQVIPTQWIIEAQARWKEDGWRAYTMTACGLDIGAGRDETVLSRLHGTWFNELEIIKGEKAKDPAHAAGLVFAYRRDNCPVIVDVGGGYGGATVALLKENGIPYTAFNASNTSTATSQRAGMKFYNKRAEAWWKLREALDPGQDGGSIVALPPDPQLKNDLAAPTWKSTTRGVQIESKEEIKTRLGRSTDRGDAAVMAFYEGGTLSVERSAVTRTHKGRPQVLHNKRGVN